MTNSIFPGIDESHLKAGEDLFKSDVQFLLGVAHLEQLPPNGYTEIAFAGRSNVGKSSLLNALVNNKNIARTSNTPGRTQEMNFFNLGDHCFLVDLPGYGYAKVSRSLVNAWTKTLKKYLKGRAPLRMTCLLIDSRHGIKKNDKEMMEMFDEAAVAYQVVLTKADKLKKSDQQKVVDQARKALLKHPAAFPEPILTSSKEKTGLDILRAKIFQAL